MSRVTTSCASVCIYICYGVDSSSVFGKVSVINCRLTLNIRYLIFQGTSGGHIDIGSDGMFQGSGAIQIDSSSASVSQSEGNVSNNTIYNFTFDANRWNTIYGNSTTVQPPARQALMIIKD